jgi:hypothetical protein
MGVGVVLVSSLASVAVAQVQGLDLTARASASRVEVGEPFSVELRAMSDGSVTASAPDLRAPGAFSVSGPSVSSQTMVQLGGGQSRTQTGMGATWQLVGKTPGRYVIPGPSVVVGRSRVQAKAIPIEVVPSSGRRRAPANPFLMPGGPGFGWPFGGPTPPSTPDELDDANDDAVKDLALAEAPDPQLFVRAVIDKTSAVVGEQLTISFYIYYRIDFEMTERHEAKLTDFVRVPLLKNPGSEPTMFAVAGGRKYAVRLLDRMALFPVRTGTLHTGSMTGRFSGRKLGARIEKASNDLVVEVQEPPVAGRPVGYSLGDVGRFALSASVAPRTVEQGGSVGVTIKVSGTGNLPPSLRVPARTGVEWLDPERKESIDPQGSTVTGYRSFGYVVRLKDSGKVDLGKVELPYWDPAAKRYATASVSLGAVTVTPSATTPSASSAPTEPSADGPTDSFSAAPAVRRTLGAFTQRAGIWPRALEGSGLWWMLAAPPLLSVVGLGGAQALRDARQRRQASRTSASTLGAQALREMERAGDDAKRLASAVERALHHAVEAATGLKARGVLLVELPRELAARGVPAELAERTRAALEACASIRFDPAATATMRDELSSEARIVSRELGRGKWR